MTRGCFIFLNLVLYMGIQGPSMMLVILVLGIIRG